ncbi:MAG: chemotaxis protein CheC [Oscillospiraceae bacterium]|nr:chemotaxis protein CheC [Oscillospiraceae bacterium]
MESKKGYVAGLSEIQLSVLEEIGNIGSGNAASALSKMLNTPVGMHVPKVRILDITELSDILGGPENQVVGILFNLHNDFEGMMMFITEKKFAHLVLNVLMDKHFDSFEDLGEMDISAIQEVGNIMVSAYMRAIAQMTNMSIGLSPPGIAIDMVGALLNVPAVEIEKYGDKALFIQDGFINNNDNVTSYLLLIPEVGYLQKVFKILGLEI